MDKASLHQNETWVNVLLLVYIILNGILCSWSELKTVEFVGSFWDVILTIGLIIFMIFISAGLSYIQAGLFLGVVGMIKKIFIEDEAETFDKFQCLALMILFSLYTFRTGKVLLMYLFFSGDVAGEISF